ncbi:MULTISPECIES: hypothetical protein [Chelatococcus]|uniref:Uncharacterized protein n=1 Tax=Chelatococcus caeni TaxID=1348468 RepID=A0A840BVF3_9HYPH|nr:MULTISPECIES: hypothetical protein [Chelatococcus]MBB4017451.1 hypothetical protein [Chelatococcus caeni]
MKSKVRKIKLMADYDCWPLWDLDEIRNVNPETLPLSATLKAALEAWAASYSETLDRDNPVESGFSSKAAAIAFNKEGRRLRDQLKVELPSFQIVYFDNELWRDPKRASSFGT